MVTLRRGFKTEANSIAREVRQELSLGLADPLDPFRLAEYLDIAVVPLTAFKTDAMSAVHHFHLVDPEGFSALTVFNGSMRLIVYNDAHHVGRQRSDVAHELSHALLQHSPGAALDWRGCRKWDPEIEEEANWLAGALLISEEAALLIVRRGMSLDEAAQTYGVTRKMVRYRLNVTAAKVRILRARGRRVMHTRSSGS